MRFVTNQKLIRTFELLKYARVVELVDTLALGASAFGRGGSSPLSRTIKYEFVLKVFQTHQDPRYQGLFDSFG